MSILNANIDDLMPARILKLNNEPGNNSGHNPPGKFNRKSQEQEPQASSSSTAKEVQYSFARQILKVKQETLYLGVIIDLLQKLGTDGQTPGNTDPQPGRIEAGFPNSKQYDPVHSAVNGNMIFQSLTIEIELTLCVPPIMDGFFLHDKTQAESDRYAFIFSESGTDFTILDKWTKCSTRICSNPSANLSHLFEYPGIEKTGLKSPGANATFMLMDGTRVTFNVRDDGAIDCVDLIKGNQHIHGIGQANPGWSPLSGLFYSPIMPDGIDADTIIPRGETLFSGGEGNEWFLASGLLVWGHPSNPGANKLSPFKQEFINNLLNAESLSIHRIEKSI